MRPGNPPSGRLTTTGVEGGGQHLRRVRLRQAEEVAGWRASLRAQNQALCHFREQVVAHAAVAPAQRALLALTLGEQPGLCCLCLNVPVLLADDRHHVASANVSLQPTYYSSTKTLEGENIGLHIACSRGMHPGCSCPA